ncbi:MAG: CusA/CzcA family heavy metal efflux RND transporter [Bacteroidales bacterium]
MLNRIIQFSIAHKLIIILLTLAMAGFGVFAILQIPVGAVPDITNNQVQVITTSTNLSTQDVEQFITYPVELEMSNLPGVTEIRSISKFGLSVVTIVFEDNVGTYLPRQLIAEKIKTASANIPEGFGTPEMGPISTGLGEIYQYILDVQPGYEDKYSIMELRTIQDWIVRRQLSGIKGVVEVNTWGGYLKQYEVGVDPERLKALDISLLEVYDAVSRNNSVAGGAYIEKTNQSFFIRGDGLVNGLEDVENIVVRNRDGVPVLVKDLATVGFGRANRFGAITANGQGEKVMGQIMMLKGANSNKVIEAVKARVEEVQKTLPEGVFINPIVERSELIHKTTKTVLENLILGCLIVFVIVVILLGNLRSGLVIASVIPLALLFTISMMYIFGIDANLMSLGALDFGIIIDGAVIMVEFIAIKLTVQRKDLNSLSGDDRQLLADRITFEGSSKMINSAIFGQVIILIVFIPVLSLSGVEGKMFRPMALSFSFALLGAMFFGLTWLPVASSLFLRPEKEKPFALTRFVMKVFYRSYDPVIRWSYDHKGVIFGLAAGSLVLTGVLFSRMGGEFVPTLDEGDFVIQPVLKTGTSLTKTTELTTKMENILLDRFPEVEKIVCRIGAAEVPTDPMSMEEIDMIIKLHPKKTWTSAESKEELANAFKEALMELPGIDYEFTQPIEMRFNELITGVRADLAIKIFGEDLGVLADKAQEVKNLVDGVPGAADVILEKTEGLPQMSVNYKRNKLAYYGLNMEDLNRQLTMAFGGESTGSVFEGERRFDLVVRLKQSARDDIEHIRNFPVILPGGSQLPLREFADISYAEGPAKISRDNTHRRVVVSVNVRNRDLESVVTDIEGILSTQLDLPSGYYLEYGGQFENLQNASKRLKLAVPIALLLIFIFLHFAFGSLKEAALIFTAVPLSIVGGVVLLAIRGMPFSISAGIGFIALFGVAVLNGIVLIEHLNDLKVHGISDMRERVLRATRERLRPVLLTAGAAAMGFLPMAVSTSAGAEVQRPLATVVIGGLVTSTLLTMLALPLLYSVVDDIKGIRIRPLRFKRNGATLLLLLLLPGLWSARGLHAQDTQVAEAATESDTLTLAQALTLAEENNALLQAYGMMAQGQEALTGAAWSVDKTQVYYNYDENNIAANDHPIGVLGVQQRFDFPTVYGSRKQVYALDSDLARIRWDQVRWTLFRDVSLAYNRLQYAQHTEGLYRHMDSLYRQLAHAAELRYQTNDIPYLDLIHARSKRDEMSVRVVQAAREADMARSELAALIQTDRPVQIPAGEFSEIPLSETVEAAEPGATYFQTRVQREEAALRLEKNQLMPDVTLGYFNGTNRYPDAARYQGVEVGVGLPLFFGEQKARIKSQQFSLDASRKMLESYQLRYARQMAQLNLARSQYREAIVQYRGSGKETVSELERWARLSYREGEIDVIRYVQSLEQALQLEAGYLENLLLYNEQGIRMQYLTIEP